MPAYRSALFWFRRDLRDDDNAGLYYALRSAERVYCVFVFDRGILDALPSRTDRRVEFIHASVAQLAQSGLKLHETLAAVTSRPARILGIPEGSLSPGAAADICLFHPDQPWVVRPDALASQGKNTPFQGLELVGRVIRTIVGGRTVYQMGSG